MELREKKRNYIKCSIKTVKDRKGVKDNMEAKSRATHKNSNKYA